MCPFKQLPQGREGLVGITMGPGSLPRALAQGSTTPGNVRMGHILFGISFYLWCLFQLHCRFLMDSHFPCSFPIIQYIFPGPCRHGLSQQVSHHQQPRFGSGEGQAHPLLPHPTTSTSLWVTWAAALAPNYLVGWALWQVLGLEVVREVMNVLM